tara:strand:- start:157 stop:585 length:429 start_codon:yes stop_codon:yes gene_type:complete
VDGLVGKRRGNYQLNVLGNRLEVCSCLTKKKSFVELTGFFRDGYCNTGPEDFGLHTVCSIMTEDFLDYSKSVGNDLITPIPQYNFKGLKEGDHWCLCASRWKQAYENGKAPKIILQSTNMHTLSLINLDLLREYDSNIKGKK